ncbi:MAG TPA: bifunctional DNA primase/polymerase [Planctomycetota bacterium]|nr:bifunctional DNA primase/polymerase [Planctomycetota bacterium]HRR82260.1 bifunctional DNA primase/polymerase [Planctomycetota bacterium]HRT94216.1 bifunctional DNA primase/polymerase [Planctomycetota bacterium]
MSEPDPAHTDNAILEAALEYAARGWLVFPLKPSGKTPLTPHGFKDATTDPEQIRAWWTQHPDANVGIRTGAVSGLVVLDIDCHGEADGEASLAKLQEDFGRLPPTLEVKTPSGGRHLYFVHRDGEVKSRNGLRPGLDLKADGGYVVAPPSALRDSPEPYARHNGHSSCPLPMWLIEQANGRRSTPAPAATLPASQVTRSAARYAETALKLEVRNLRQAPEGTRNDTLNRAAFSLGQLVGGGYLDRAHVEAELAATAAITGLGEREAAATIQSGLEAGIQEPRRVEMRRPRRSLTSPAPGPNGVILIPGPHWDDQDRYIEQSCKTFADQVLGALPPDLIYRKSHLPGELLGKPGARRWDELSADRSRLLVDEHMKLGAWYPRKNDEGSVLVYKPCSGDNAALALAGAKADPRVRDLDLLVCYPVYGPDFQRVQPGWHDGIYYDEPPELQGIEPQRDLEHIHEELHELVVDFPFKDEASRQNFIGLMLTPLVAPAIDGNRPLHLLLSPLERTGKSKLAAEVLGGVILGRETPALQLTDRDEERDKRLLALLLQGETVVHLDNLPRALDSAALSSILTATSYQGRILGASKIVSLANTVTFVASGNNTECSGEIAKRTVPIQLQPNTPNPEARQDFLYPNLRAHIRSSRARIFAVLLGMIENWLEKGRPLHKNRLGGFEAWSETIGGILHANCFNRWRTNEAEWRKSANPTAQEWETFVAAWWEKFGPVPVSVAELMRVADDEECFPDALSRRTERGRQVAFGTLLRQRVNTPIAQVTIRREGCGTHSAYFLERRHRE